MKRCRAAILGLLCLLLPAYALAGEVYYPSGTYFFTETDLKVAARGIPMVWERTYRSNRIVKRPGQRFFDFKRPTDGPLGFGWHTPWSVRIEGDHFVAADGRNYPFDKSSDGTYLPDAANGYTLTRTAAGSEVQETGGNTFLFDSAGRLTAVRDPLGRSAILTYDASGNMVGISDTAGRSIYSFSYSGTHVSRVTDLAGRSLDYGYDGSGNLIKVNHNGETVATYTYNADHGLASQGSAVGDTWRIGYLYPDKGIVNRVTDPAGRNLTLKYDFENRIFHLTDFGGLTRRFILDVNGNVVSDSEMKNNTATSRQTVQYLADGTRRSYDAEGNATVEKRDERGNVLARTDAEGNTTTFNYNAQNKPTTVTDPLGVVTRFEYDASGIYPTKITRGVGTADEVATTFSYSLDGDLAATGTDGATTSFTYNQAGLPLSVSDPLGNVSKLEYDAVGNVTASIDASGNRSEFVYDWRGNLTTARDPLGNVTTYSYNRAGRLTAVTDPMGRTTTTATDFAGRITSLIPPAASTKSFAYDGGGNLIKVTEGDAVTTLAYDGQNRLVAETDPEGNLTVREYGNIGCTSCGGSASSTPKRIVDPLGNATLNSLDRLGRVTGVQDPLGNLTGMVYDKVGRVTSRTDAEGNATTYAYDGLGRVTSQPDANGGVTSFTYDRRGNLLSLTDPEGNSTAFAYDLAGRKTRETRPMGQATEYNYYTNGLLKNVKDAKGQVTTYGYDKANRLTEILFADGRKHTFGYDAAGNMTSYASPDVAATIAYDAANRKTSETVTMGGFTKTYGYTYDSRGNKASFTTPEGTTYGYTYNKNGQPTHVSTRSPLPTSGQGRRN